MGGWVDGGWWVWFTRLAIRRELDPFVVFGVVLLLGCGLMSVSSAITILTRNQCTKQKASSGCIAAARKHQCIP